MNGQRTEMVKSGETEGDCFAGGSPSESGVWFQRQDDAYQNEQFVISKMGRLMVRQR